jgi:chondroitin sulfate synthase
MDVINGFSKVRGRVIEFKENLYGYHRMIPLYGEEYVLDLLMTYKKYRGKKMTVPVRRHAYIQRPFAPLQLRHSTEPGIPERILIQNFDGSASASAGKSDETGTPTKIVLIVPLSGRLATFERFLQAYFFSCDHLGRRMGKAQSKGAFPEWNLNLVVVYFGTDDEKENFHNLVSSYRQNRSESKNSSLSGTSCQIRVVQVDGEFSRGIALETGISQCNDNDLLVLIDVDIVFSPRFIEKVLLNTIQGEQVNFPIVFSTYDPKLFPQELKGADSFQISNERGYWREYGFGIAAFYKSDFRTVGGFDVSIKGWGKEDVALFDKFIRTNLRVFRAPDPELLHMYHPIVCDSKLSHSQYEMCLGTQSNTLGSVKSLSEFIFQNRNQSARLQKIADFIFNPL